MSRTPRVRAGSGAAEAGRGRASSRRSRGRAALEARPFLRRLLRVLSVAVFLRREDPTTALRLPGHASPDVFLVAGQASLPLKSDARPSSRA
jgi:hypothetical protein